MGVPVGVTVTVADALAVPPDPVQASVNVPVLVNAVTFMDMPYRMAGEEPEHFAQYFAQTLSRGGNPSTYIMGTPGQIPYPCLPVAGEITRFLKRWRHVYDGRKLLALATIAGKPPPCNRTCIRLCVRFDRLLTVS